MSPGLALFEAGLIRMKNSVTFVSQIFMGLSVLSIMWLIFGFSLSHGTDSGGFIGNFANVMFNDISYTRCFDGMQVSQASYAAFMMMFAIISPLLMTGGYAERVPFPAFLSVSVLWELFVYYPVSHWMWGDGWLAKNGAKDFAGGIVIHTTAGVSCLVACYMLGPRRNHQKDQESGGFPYSNLITSTIGASILWMGWFGFNAGSALTSGSDAVHALFNTHIAACASTVAFVAVHKMIYKKHLSAIAMLNGAIAGMAGVTPAAGYITHGAALFLGLLLGALSCASASAIRSRFNVDDALDVSSVHGLTGVIGSIFTGFCYSDDLSFQQGASPADVGLIYGGRGSLLLWQCIAVLTSGLWAGAWTFVIFKVTSKFTAIRISERGECVGLDLECHGEMAILPDQSSISPQSDLSTPLIPNAQAH